MRVFPIDGIAGGYETLSSITSSTGFTSAKIAPATGNFTNQKCRSVLISVETGDILFTFDGTTPVIATGVGHLLTIGSSYEISGEKNVENFRCINAVAGNGAKVKCTFLF